MQERMINDTEKSVKPNWRLLKREKPKQEASWLKRCVFFKADCKLEIFIYFL